MSAIEKRPQMPSEADKRFEPQAKVLAANGVAQSLSFTTERKYLNHIGMDTHPFRLEVPAVHRIAAPADPFWIRISQVGRPMEDSPEKCFTAIQKILMSCFLPSKTQLLFLINGTGGKYEMYLGVRSFDKQTIDKSFAESLQHFMEGVWPGIKCSKGKKASLDEIKNHICDSYHIDALSGIPSMESQYKTLYPATIDNLLAGMREKDFTYLVVADPIPTNDIDGILYQCREFNGQAESLKSFNFTENMSSSVGKSFSKAHSITDSTSESDSKSSSRKSMWGTVGAGLILASWIFPPAGAVTTAISTAGAILEAGKEIAGVDLLSSFTPTKTKTHTTSKSHSETDTNTETDSFTEQQGKSISKMLSTSRLRL